MTLSDSIGKMDEFLQDTKYSSYAPQYMKQKLSDFYGQNIIISGGSGKPTIVAYRQTVDSILRECHKKPKDVDVKLQKIQLIETLHDCVKMK